jgi:hypothetical protein
MVSKSAKHSLNKMARLPVLDKGKGPLGIADAWEQRLGDEGTYTTYNIFMIGKMGLTAFAAIYFAACEVGIVGKAHCDCGKVKDARHDLMNGGCVWACVHGFGVQRGRA